MKMYNAKLTKLLSTAVAAVILFAGIASIHSQDDEAKGAKRKSKKAAAGDTKSDKKSANRLPVYFGKIGLTDEQREKIYAVQAKSSEQIDALKKQLQDLEQKRDDEIQAVLTAEQKTKLAELQSEAKQAKKTRREAREGGPLRGRGIRAKTADEKGGDTATDKKSDAKGAKKSSDKDGK